MSLNLGTVVSDSASLDPSRTALIFDDETFNYEELDSLIRRFAYTLKIGGLEIGDRVAMMVPNGPPFTIAYFGILYAGGVAVTMNTLQSVDEVTHQLRDCNATAFVLDGEFGVGLDAFVSVENCQNLYWIGNIAPDCSGEIIIFDAALKGTSHADIHQTQADDTAVILYTSGTTGKPKGAELTHFNLYYNAQHVCERSCSNWPQEINILGPGHVALAALPLYHIFGQTNVQNALLFGGGSISYLRRFYAKDAVKVIVRDAVTFFPGVPTMFFEILYNAETRDSDLSNLQHCVCGGGPMPREVKRRFEDRFNVNIQEAYGLTETSPLTSHQRKNETSKCGTIGKPIAGVEMQVVNEEGRQVSQGDRGEIVIRGHNIMKGYYKNPKATARALRGGWFHSGDIGYVDEDGDFVIVDRKKELILRGGYNVYPREVEEVLYGHPAIREAAVIGVPDERLGEEVKAVVSLQADSQVTAKEIQQYCKVHVAAYKYPRLVDILENLPKSSTGKILKRVLREKG